ncbi:hypothetical protein BDZ89DRAFT_1064983 [Hymenopellis radicata]|nr:hypothetical protein BDZ89DRAFT_1064983 [Hymenopellis radicata]
MYYVRSFEFEVEEEPPVVFDNVELIHTNKHAELAEYLQSLPKNQINLTRLIIRGRLGQNEDRRNGAIFDDQMASAIAASKHPLVAFECHYYHPTALSPLLTAVHETLVWLRITAGPLYPDYSGPQDFSLPISGFSNLRELYISFGDSATGLLLAMAEAGLPALRALELTVNRMNDGHIADLLYISQVLASYGPQIEQLIFQTLNARSHTDDEQQWTNTVLNQLPNLKDLAIGNIGSFVNYPIPYCPKHPKVHTLRLWYAWDLRSGSLLRRDAGNLPGLKTVQVPRKSNWAKHNAALMAEEGIVIDFFDDENSECREVWTLGIDV